VNVRFAHRAPKDVDVEVSVATHIAESITPGVYLRTNANVQLLRFGEVGALALAPGLGDITGPSTASTPLCTANTIFWRSARWSESNANGVGLF
jgi:hypothetical protein